MENNFHNIEIALRPDVKATLIIPRDISESEAKLVISVVNLLIDKTYAQPKQQSTK